MKICCKNYRDLFSQFKVVYEYTKAGKSLVGTEGFKTAMSSDPVEYKELDVYERAFHERVSRSGKEASA